MMSIYSPFDIATDSDISTHKMSLLTTISKI